MEEISINNGFDFLLDKGWLKHVSEELKEKGENLSQHIDQCFYPDCQAFWFVGGEFKTNEIVANDEVMRTLKESILVLNQIKPVTTAELQAVGLADVSHGPCRLCLREKRLADFRRRQENNNYPPCFGTKQAGEGCDREICAEDRRWDCSHPCTIHPEREYIRNRRKRLLQIYYQTIEKSQAVAV